MKMKCVFIMASTGVGALAACGEDDLLDSPQTPSGTVVDGGIVTVTDSGPDTPPILPIPDGGEAGTGEPPLYFFSTMVFTGANFFTYVSLADRFDSSLSSFDGTKDGLELPSYPNFALEFGAAFAAHPSRPEITRLDVGLDRKLFKGKTITFAGASASGIEAVLFVNPEKAYFFDVATAKAIVWNPTTMELTGKTIDISAFLKLDIGRAAVPNGKSLNVRKSGAEWTLPVYYVDTTTFKLVRAAGVAILNVETDTVVSVVHDDRCYDGVTAVASASGDYYYFPGWGSANDFYMKATAPKPHTCALRLPAGQNTFDATSVLDLTTLAGGDDTGNGGGQGAVSDGANGFYFTVADDTRYAANSGFPNKLWHYDFTTQTAKVVAGAAWWGQSTMDRRAYIDGVMYAATAGFSDADPGGFRTEIFRFSPDGVSSFQMKGWVDGFGRIR